MQHSEPSKLRSSLVSAAAVLLVLLVCVEISVAIARLITPKLFGNTAAVSAAIDRIDPARFATFAARARTTPAVWDATAGTTKARNCLGSEFTLTYDASGARVYAGYDPALATVLFIGDSYTAGDEAQDDQTIAAHFHRRTGVVAANLGINAYSPLQAVLKLERSAANFPSAKVVVLGVMFENIRRNVNSYTAVFTGEDGVFGVRPYISGSDVLAPPASIFDGLDAFKGYARDRLAVDHWATPQPSFPNTLSLVRLVSSPSFAVRNTSRVMKLFGRQYQPDYADAALTRALTVVARRFEAAAHAANLTPVVIFVPQNGSDQRSPQLWIEQYKSDTSSKMDVRLMDTTGIDWSRYNLGPGGSCHPSSEGYDAIAKAYVAALSLATAAK